MNGTTPEQPGTDEPRQVGTDEPRQAGGFSRRSFLGRAAVTGAAAAVHVAALSRSVPFYGPKQAGIATTAQDRLAFAAFDVVTSDVNALQRALGQWAAAAARMTAGLPIGATETLPNNPPIDTGEAVGLSPAQLTITVGFGPSLFDDRFGLASRRPAALIDLPGF
jgi:deferrochelatase/peroxidase EfeB